MEPELVLLIVDQKFIEQKKMGPTFYSNPIGHKISHDKSWQYLGGGVLLEYLSTPS